MTNYLVRVGIKASDLHHVEGIFHTIILTLNKNNLWFSKPQLKDNSIVSEKDVFNHLSDNQFCKLFTNDEKTYAKLELYDSEIRFYIFYGANYLTKKNNKIIESCTNFYVQLYDKIKGRGHYLDWIGVSSQYDFPKLFPPVTLDCFYWGYALTLFTKDNININFTKSEEAYATLRNAELPEELSSIKRILGDEYIIFQLVDDTTDIIAWEQISNAQQKWLKELFAPPTSSRFNEFGDEKMLPMGLEKNKFVTFYNKIAFIAYQTFTVKGGKIENLELLKKICVWKKEQAMPDGHKLLHVTIILPNRENVFAIKDQIFEHGVDEIYYVDDDAKFRNPFPKGNWIKQ